MIFWLEAGPASARPSYGKAAVQAALGLAVFLCGTVLPAQAQYYDWREGYYDDGPDGPGPMYPDGPGPYGDGYERPYQRPQRPPQQHPAEQSPERSSAGMSLADIRDRAAQRGMHLIATPRRKGRIYLAAAEDAHGLRYRLVFDAYDGHLIENTPLGPKTPGASSSRAQNNSAR